MPASRSSGTEWFPTLCVISICLSISISITILVLASVFTTYHCQDPESLNTVSGFYGPGAFFAWCVTVISTLATNEFYPPTPTNDISLLPQNSPSHGPTIKASSLPKVSADKTPRRSSTYDPSLLTTVAFPILASVNALHLLATDSNPSQRRAALVVAEIGLSVCVVGMLAALWAGPEPRKFRVYAWASGVMSCGLAMGSGVLREIGPLGGRHTYCPTLSMPVCTSAIFQTVIQYVAGLAAAITIVVVFIIDKTNPPKISMLLGLLVPGWIVAFPIVRSVLSGSQSGGAVVTCEHRFRLAVPQSAVGLGELDQAAALGVAVVCSAAIPALLRVHDTLMDAQLR